MARDVEAIARKLLVARDLLSDVLDALSDPQPQPEPQGCTHPLNQREDLTPLGTSVAVWRCKACGVRSDQLEVLDGR